MKANDTQMKKSEQAVIPVKMLAVQNFPKDTNVDDIMVAMQRAKA